MYTNLNKKTKKVFRGYRGSRVIFETNKEVDLGISRISLMDTSYRDTKENKLINIVVGGKRIEIKLKLNRKFYNMQKYSKTSGQRSPEG